MRASLRFFGAAGLVVLACAPVQAGTLATSALFSGNGDDLVCMLSNVGTTPLANIVVPIGDHEVVWRHPEFGERRQTVRVTAGTPARIGMDFSQ